MYHFLQKFHSGWAFLALLLLVITAIVALYGIISKRQFTNTDRKIALFALVGSHIQLVVGLVLYFVSPLGFQLLGNMEKQARLTSLEHPLINIIAIILITVGWSKHKSQVTDLAKFKKIAFFYGIGLVLITSRIPFNLWLK